MTETATVSTESSKPEQDLAPTAAPTLQTDELTPITAPQQTQALASIDPSKRSKTGGEHLFDATTYAGVGLVGNEVSASYIVGQKDKGNFLGRAYRKCDEFCKNLGKPGKLPYLQNRFNYISFAIIGGFTVLPIIIGLERFKGSLVRFADRIFHGDRVNDPEIAKRHEEMDNAPQQSLGSLGKGRLLTVAAAYTVDATVNWKEGLLARALKGTRFENHASFEHLSDHASDWINKKVTDLRKLAPEKIEGQRKFIGNLVGLTTLSALLTILFYVSSKVFAKKRDEKIERQYERLHGHNDTAQPDEAALEQELTKIAERPRPQVESVTRDTTITPAPQLATSV